MVARSTMEPDIERLLEAIAGGFAFTVTLVSYGLRAAIIHSSIRIRRAVYTVVTHKCAFRQGTAYTCTTESLPFPSLVVLALATRRAVPVTHWWCRVQAARVVSKIIHEMAMLLYLLENSAEQTLFLLRCLQPSALHEHGRQGYLEVRRAWSRPWNVPIHAVSSAFGRESI